MSAIKLHACLVLGLAATLALGDAPAGAQDGLEITGPTDLLLTGETVQFGTIGAVGDSLLWASTDTLVLTVSPDGLATAVGPGRCRVSVQAGPTTAYSGILTVAGWEVVVGSVTVYAGDLVFPVGLSASFSSPTVLAFDFQLEFDPTILELVSVTGQATLTGSWGDPEFHQLEDRITVAHAGTEGLQGSGDFVRLLFRLQEGVSPESATPLVLSSIRFNEGDPAVRPRDGHVTVGSEPVDIESLAITPERVDVVPGQSVQFQALAQPPEAGSVFWSLLETGAPGVLNQQGLYTAPALVAARDSVTVVATSFLDAGFTASAVVTLWPLEQPGLIQLSAVSNPGQARSVQILVTPTEALLEPPTVTANDQPVVLTTFDTSPVSYLGRFHFDIDVVSATITASGSSASSDDTETVTLHF